MAKAKLIALAKQRVSASLNPQRQPADRPAAKKAIACSYANQGKCFVKLMGR